jgi:hypothetical protein
LSEIEFAYLGRENESSDPVWHDDWKEGARMPEAVRIRIKPMTGSAWPEMVVPLKVAQRVRGGVRGP